MRIGNSIHNRMRGLSLVELMVAITIGAILLGGAVTLFINNRDTYKTTNELSRLQETARYALDMMVKDIRMAGYFGCADRLDTVSLNIPIAAGDEGSLWDFNLNPAGTVVPPIEGMEASAAGTGFQPSGFAVTVGTDGDNGDILAGTDAITLRYIAGTMSDVNPANGTLDFQVTGDAISGTDTTITVDSTTGLNLNQVAAITDCGGSDIFQINAAPTATTVQANDLSRGYNATSSPMIAPFVAVRYYIGDNGRGPGGAVYPALYRAVIQSGGLAEDYQELFEGVEQMQILYGVDDDNDNIPDSYVRAGDAPLDVDANWVNIVSVRLAIVVRTIDEHGRSGDVDGNTYRVNDHDNTLRPEFDPADDRRRRRVFTTTAVVRNLS
jgi:type IV pilus assembly protein PilW